MNPYLKWTDPQGKEQIYTLSADEVLIGRRADADIIFPNAHVSRRHAKLIKGKDGYSIVNLPNTHGIYVNGQAVQERELRHGDRIRLGVEPIELRYFIHPEDAGDRARPADEFETSWADLSTIFSAEFGQYSDLEKMSSLLDFQYQWEKKFSAEKTFYQILKAALRISRAERGYILLKRQDTFEYVSGLGANGELLPESEFRASQSVARQVTRDGKAVHRAEQIDGTLAAQQSIVDLRLSSVACMPLSWLSPESDVPTINGVLYLDSTRSMRVLSQLDQKILNKLAVEAASVFEKLELVRTFEQRKSLELELALAQRELQAADALRHAESRVLLAEYGASMGRFAAALSHELNSPIGALKTALQTSAVLAERKATMPPEKRAGLEEMETQLRRTAIDSLERLHQIVLRMQRFTNLDRSEILQVDLNSLLQDVVDMFQAEIKADIHVELDLQQLPSIFVRPQQLSAVFANLLENATEELEVGGHVRLTTHQLESQVEITIEDDGHGLPAEELANIFDPAFKVKSGRVSTGNWSLFSSRQIVWEHGGEIELQSAPGKGTTVRVKLPCSEST
jgi:signal transduction histidine kinase